MSLKPSLYPGLLQFATPLYGHIVVVLLGVRYSKLAYNAIVRISTQDPQDLGRTHRRHWHVIASAEESFVQEEILLTFGNSDTV